MTSLSGRRRRRTVLGALAATLALAGLTSACTSGGSDAPSGAGAVGASASDAGATGSIGSTDAPADASTTSAPQGVTISVSGGASRTWTAADLVKLPRTNVTAADGTPVAGVSLPTIADLSVPAPSTAAAPFVTYDVTGSDGTVLLTRAESDPKIGDHPALLTIIQDQRIDLVVPQDRSPARTLLGVTSVTVSTVTPATADPSPGRGSLVVRTGGATRTVSLTALPQRGYALHRPGGATSQEQGARLTEVLAAAGVTPRSNQLVTVAGPSGAAVLTGGELISNLQEVGFSLVQNGRVLGGPLFFVAGDVTGARTVTGATTVTVTG